MVNSNDINKKNSKRKGTARVRLSGPSAATQDTDSFLWRGSSELKNWISSAASEKDVSSNAVMTAALLVASMLDGVPKLGPPRNVLQLLDEIEEALTAKALVWGHLHVDDWAGVQGCVQTFLKTGLITEPQTKTDTRIPNAVAYSFRTTRAGQDVLPTAIQMLRPVFQAMAEGAEVTGT